MRAQRDQRVYSEGIAALVSAREWQAISPEQQQQILVNEGVTDLPSPDVSTPDSILSSLRSTSLPAWRTRTDALPQQFTRARLAAAKLSEPKAQQVKLKGGTLRQNRCSRQLVETENIRFVGSRRVP